MAGDAAGRTMSAAASALRPFRLNLTARIVALLLAVVVVVPVGGFVLADTAGRNAARTTIGDELIVGEQVFRRALSQEEMRLAQGARLLAADYAFREAIATGDRNTIVSVLGNHGKRIDADLTLLIGLDGKVIADSVGESAGSAFPHPELLKSAESNQQASGLMQIGGALYHVGLVPVLAPLPVAWVAIGYRVDDDLANILRGPMRFHVSLFSGQAGGGWKLQASTLDASLRDLLVRDVVDDRFAALDARGNAVYEAGALTRVLRLRAGGNDAAMAVLQEPLAAALEPYHRLQQQLALISLV